MSGRFPGLNEYIDAERTNRYKAAAMKRDCMTAVAYSIKASPQFRAAQEPVFVKFLWYEKNRRRDMDNIAGFGHKVVFDALVRAGVIQNDGWSSIAGFSDSFFVDERLPRVEIIITEGVKV